MIVTDLIHIGWQNGASATASGPLPRIIWCQWTDGLDDAPEMVLRCLQSWVHFNPDWQVCLITRETIGEVLDLDATLGPGWEQMEIQALSNIIRLNLLAEHGGVWTDATVMCRKPLDAWLAPFLSQGWFAFDRPAPDRPIATWFMAGLPGALILDRLNEVSNRFWRANPHRGAPSSYALERSAAYSDMAVLRFDGTELRIDPADLDAAPASAGLDAVRASVLEPGEAVDYAPFARSYPYFWLHSMFDALATDDAAFARTWAATPRLSADVAHFVQTYGMSSPATDAFRCVWDHGIAPLYKLDMWHAEREPDPASALGHVLDQRNW